MPSNPPSREAREMLAAEYEADDHARGFKQAGLYSAILNRRFDRLARRNQIALRAIDRALSSPSDAGREDEIEAVARAIGPEIHVQLGRWKIDGSRPTWEQIYREAQDIYRNIATLAVAALSHNQPDTRERSDLLNEGSRVGYGCGWNEAVEEAARVARFSRSELEPFVSAAALTWCGEKDRETFPDDILYFKENWWALEGLKGHVRATAIRSLAKEKGGG